MTGLLDREKGDSYTLTIVADDGGPKRDSTVVILSFRSFKNSKIVINQHYVNTIAYNMASFYKTANTKNC